MWHSPRLLWSQDKLARSPAYSTDSVAELSACPQEPQQELLLGGLYRGYRGYGQVMGFLDDMV